MKLSLDKSVHNKNRIIVMFLELSGDVCFSAAFILNPKGPSSERDHDNVVQPAKTDLFGHSCLFAHPEQSKL